MANTNWYNAHNFYGDFEHLAAATLDDVSMVPGIHLSAERVVRGMSIGRFFRPVTTILNWPASAFAGVERTYDVPLPASHVCALIRRGVPVDPLFQPVGEALARSNPLEIVGRVQGERFEVYYSGRAASGLGIIGEVEQTAAGSRVVARVGWAGLFKWGAPIFTAGVLIVIAAVAVSTALSDRGSQEWHALAVAILGAGQMMNLVIRGRRLRNEELPMLFERLEQVLRATDARGA